MIYQDKRKIYASLCDTTPSLSIIGIFQIVEDAITNLMGELKIDGITTLKKYDAMWVFSKNRIKFVNSVTWNDEIEVKAFISKITPIKLVFDTALFKGNTLIAYSKAEACAVDIKTKTIRRTNTVGINENITFETELENFDFSHYFFDKEKFSNIATNVVHYTNLDYLHHTNNVEYLRILLNTFSCNELEQNKIKEIEIAYKNQSFENDNLNISTFKENDRLYYIISRDETTIVQGEIVS